MLTGLLCFTVGMRRTDDFGRHPQHPLPPGGVRRLLILAVVVARALIVLPAADTGHRSWLAILAPMGLVTLVAAPLWAGWMPWHGGLATAERRSLGALAWMLAAGGGFWLIFAQNASVMGIFARDDTRRDIAGVLIPSSWFQALRPLFVLSIAPLSAWWFARRRPGARTFALAVFAAGSSFLLMAVGAGAAAVGPVSPLWLIAAYLLQSCGELVVGPAGLALAVRLAPPGWAGRYLGLYGLFAALGVAAGNGFYHAHGHLSAPSYFVLCGTAVTVVAAVLAVAAPAVNRRIADHPATPGVPLEERSTAVSRPPAAVPE